MAETVIQLKRSTTTATPTSLSIGEPAYSYSSNTFFIGSPDGTGVLQIGGFAQDQLLIYGAKHANLSFNAANTSQTHANKGFDHANAAFDSGNTNATSATAAQTHADQAFEHANSGFDVANTKFASAGGTVTGDVTIQGGLTVEGTTTTVDSTTVKIADNILTLNSAIDQASAPILDAGIEIDRGSSANVILKYSESDDHWQFTNDGTNFENIGAASAEVYANGAFVAANTAQVHANKGFDHANAAFASGNTNATIASAAQTHADQAFEHANAGFDIANTDVTGVSVSGGAIHVGEADKVSAFHLAANGRVLSANSTAISLAASAITSGTLGVARGGTGAATHTTNGVLLGQGTSAVTTASSSTEGHILTINGSGVPTFSMLEGGTF